MLVKLRSGLLMGHKPPVEKHWFTLYNYIHKCHKNTLSVFTCCDERGHVTSSLTSSVRASKKYIQYYILIPKVVLPYCTLLPSWESTLLYYSLHFIPRILNFPEMFKMEEDQWNGLWA